MLHFESVDFFALTPAAMQASAPSTDFHHGFDLSERSGLTEQRRARERPSIDPASPEKQRRGGQHEANVC